MDAAEPPPGPSIHEAIRGSIGVVLRGVEIDEAAATARRRRGLDMVVCVAVLSDNRRLAGKIEAAVGPSLRQDPHPASRPGGAAALSANLGVARRTQVLRDAPSQGQATMNDFTPELYAAMQSQDDEAQDAADAAWERAAEAYSRRYDAIRPRLPGPVVAMKEGHYLHDGDVISIGQEGDTFVITLRPEAPEGTTLVLLYTLTAPRPCNPTRSPSPCARRIAPGCMTRSTCRRTMPASPTRSS